MLTSLLFRPIYHTVRFSFPARDAADRDSCAMPHASPVIRIDAKVDFEHEATRLTTLGREKDGESVERRYGIGSPPG